MSERCEHVKWKWAVNHQVECVNCGFIVSYSEFILWRGT